MYLRLCRSLFLGALVLAVLSGCSPNEDTTVDRVDPAAEAQPPAPAELPSSLQIDDLDAFLDAASLQLVLRSPETITHLGLGGVLGVGDAELTPLSAAYREASQALETAVADHLLTFDLNAVSDATRLNAQVYGSYLQDSVDGQRFADHQYHVHPGITSYPQSLERFMTATHPIRTEQNALDYLSRLAQFEERYDELLAALARSEAVGAVLPRFLVQEIYGTLRQMADTSATASPLYTSFEARLGDVSPLDAVRRDDLLRQAETMIAERVLPAYGRLADYLAELAQRAGNDEGVWKMEDGDAYYAYLLRHYTTTPMSADEIHVIGLSEVERIQEEIHAVAASLGYDRSLSMAELFASARRDAGLITGGEVLAECEQIVEAISARVESAFHRFPRQELEVVPGEQSAFYSPGSLDGSRPGKFYAPIAVSTARYRLPTLVHHEAIPGHHFQIAFAHELSIPAYRAGLSFTAYAEGWALYAERLAWELGAYDEDPYGNLGRLQDEIFRAARLVVDTGIHAKRWGYQRAVDYMVEVTGLETMYVQREVARYIAFPGQATSYKIGMLKMLELRARAESELGDAFDLADFHDAVLREGSVPLVILESLIDEHIEQTLQET